MADATTLDTLSSDAGEAMDRLRRAYALVLIWSATEPQRVGEVIFPGDRPSVLGRGGDESGEGRVSLLRQRPGVNEPTLALESPFISREQLRIRTARDGISIENLGKRALLIDGQATDAGVVRDGGTVEVKSQLLFLCARRTPSMAPLENRTDSAHAFGGPDPQDFVGETSLAWELRDQIAFLAACSPHVLVLGESGTGKELVAQAIHSMSQRRARKLVARNAATFPAGLIDAELFGNVANYPNAGMPERAGLVGEADGSTLFLDEIGELPSELQSHLLRLLDERGEYQRLGDARRRTADVRLIAATNRGAHELKHDLVARLPLRLEMPGLNERREDVPLLVRHLLRRRAARDAPIALRFFASADPAGEPRTAPELVRALVTHQYRGHVRELEALLWRSLATSRGGSLELTDAVRAEIDGPRTEAAIELSADRIREALARHGGVKERVWRELGLASRFVLHRLMKKHGIAGDDEGDGRP